MKKILICYGTRPEYIKIEPILFHESVQFHDIRTLFTGQHKDLVKGVAKPDYTFEMHTCSPNRLNSIVSSMYPYDYIYIYIIYIYYIHIFLCVYVFKGFTPAAGPLQPKANS